MSEMFVISVNSNHSQLHLHSQFAIWKVKLQPGKFTCAKTGTRWQMVYFQYFNQPEPGDMRAKQRAKTVITFPVRTRLRDFISICCFHWKSAISVSIWLLITRILFGIKNENIQIFKIIIIANEFYIFWENSFMFCRLHYRIVLNYYIYY